MSFSIIQVVELSGGRLKVRCLKCGEQDEAYPTGIYDSGVINVMTTFAQICSTGNS